jgi:hypothetical protein
MSPFIEQKMELRWTLLPPVYVQRTRKRSGCIYRFYDRMLGLLQTASPNKIEPNLNIALPIRIIQIVQMYSVYTSLMFGFLLICRCCSKESKHNVVMYELARLQNTDEGTWQYA